MHSHTNSYPRFPSYLPHAEDERGGGQGLGEGDRFRGGVAEVVACFGEEEDAGLRAAGEVD